MADESKDLNPETESKTALQLGKSKLLGSEKHLREINFIINRFCKGLDEKKILLLIFHQ